MKLGGIVFRWVGQTNCNAKCFGVLILVLQMAVPLMPPCVVKLFC